MFASRTLYGQMGYKRPDTGIIALIHAIPVTENAPCEPGHQYVVYVLNSNILDKPSLVKYLFMYKLKLI